VHLEVVEGGSGDETVDDEIMKIVTEALSNALRHASASLVEVVLAHEAEQIVARVGDNGVGFDPDSQSTGMGLENLRVRAALLSGAISIVSRPGEGTKLEARFPIRSRAPR
jgi:signal transduction histidine kinase